MKLVQQLEAILFIAGRPLGLKKICQALNCSAKDALAALETLKGKYGGDSGVVLLENNQEWQLATHPQARELAEELVRAEISGELTRPQLETLTVVSYCGPITKPELEQIRGVNCGLILRNLLLRGLIKETGADQLLPTYEVTMEYLRHLGIQSARELPDYETLHRHPFIAAAADVKF